MIPAVNERHILFTTKLIREWKRRIAEAFPDTRLFVFAAHAAGLHFDTIRDKLANSGIEFYDYRALINGEDMHIPHDGHPSAKPNALLAHKLVKDLGIGCESLKSKFGPQVFP